MKRLIISCFLFALSFMCVNAFAQDQAGSGIQAFIQSKGGLASFILLLVGSANAILTAVRGVLLKWDGIAEGAAIPADQKALTIVNKACQVLGKVLDFLMGNPQH